jgi:hypothetical protein
MPSPGFDVFLSHSSQDHELAKAMKVYLGNEGIHCWMAPEDILPGKRFAEAITDALRECEVFVVILTDDSMQSWYVLDELTTAKNKKRIIIPFRGQDIIAHGVFEFLLASTQWLNGFPDIQQAFKTLSATINQLLGREPIKTDSTLVQASPTSPSLPEPSRSIPENGISPVVVDIPTTSSTLETRQQADLTADQQQYLDALTRFESFAGDAELRAGLGWDQAKIDQTKASLISRGFILGRADRGGASALLSPRLVQLTRELADDSLPGCVFVNIGEPKHSNGTKRAWDRCVTYGFVSAGWGSLYRQSMERIRPGAIIYAYSSGCGYLGVGTALEPAMPLRMFDIDGVLLQDMGIIPDEDRSSESAFFHSLDDDQMCEWVVRVKWEKTLPRDQAINKSGLFVFNGTSCRIRDAITVQYLRSCLNQEHPEEAFPFNDLGD